MWAPVARRLRDEIDALGVPALLGDRRREGDLLMLAGIGDPSDRDWLADRLAAVTHAAVEHELGGGHRRSGRRRRRGPRLGRRRPCAP